MATEMNTDRSILTGDDSSCQALELSCAKSDKTVGVNSDVKIRSRWLQSNNIRNEKSLNATTSAVELCIQRRLGLAMGVSIQRYRKINRAFDIQRDALGTEFSILRVF